MKRFLKSRFVSNYGAVFVLLGLIVYYSIITWSEQHPADAAAGRALARRIVDAGGGGVLIVARDTEPDRLFTQAIEQELTRLAGPSDAGSRVYFRTVLGEPSDVRAMLENIGNDPHDAKLHFIATHHAGAEWGPLQAEKLEALAEKHPSLKGVRVITPDSYRWPSFLTRDNLFNIINQNADVAIIAIGMTLVIITAGIDLSVGSVLALCGVIISIVIQKYAGGKDATAFGLIGGAMAGIGVGILAGLINGAAITFFRVPAFIITLAMMMIARGLSLIIAVDYQTALKGGGTEALPEAVKIEAVAYSSLGNGDILGIPAPIVLMFALYVIAHITMKRTSFGRYVYAVGGNPEAARLSGVPVRGVLLAVYALCGAMAAIGGIVDSSRFEGGRPGGGEQYELRVIAAVVVGGTSLAGGEGRIFGTLIGAMIMAVIQNGLTMANVKPYERMVIFGLLILAAVLLDQWKKRAMAGKH